MSAQLQLYADETIIYTCITFIAKEAKKEARLNGEPHQLTFLINLKDSSLV